MFIENSVDAEVSVC